MLNDQNKSVVLSALNQQATPITLAELLKLLGQNYPERTVRRWLAEWVEKGLVQKTGQKRGTHYLAKQNKATDIDFSPESQRVLEQVKLPYAFRKPVTYQSAWLNEYIPNVDSYLSLAQQKKLYEAGNRTKNHKTAGTYARKIYNRLLIDLSYNSSRLEGNTYSLLETKNLLLEGTESPGKLDEEKTMILNHKEAIRYLINNGSQADIEESIIYTLHFLLSDGLVSPQYAGKVRDYGVRIGGSVYIPLEDPKALRTYLSNICSKANQIANPHEKSIFLLAHVAYLQAFVDVNKRTARLSANTPLVNANLVPLSFDAINQADYTNSMIAIYEFNNIKPLVDLYLHSYLRTAELYDVTIESIGFDRVRVQYRQQRREMIRHIVIKKLYGEKMEKFINSSVGKFVDPNDLAQLVINIHDDIEQLGADNIGGLGITLNEFKDWLKGK